MDELETMIYYISAWMWQIIALMFLIASLILFAIRDNLKGETLYVAFFFIFVGCEFVAFKRRRTLKNE